MRRFLRNHGPALFWALLIFVVSSIPSLKAPDLGFRTQDKAAHAIEYAVFGFFLFRSFGAFVKNPRHIIFWVLIAGIFYAGTDELHQLLVPGRRADWLDFSADAAGVFFSQVLMRIKIRK